MRPEPGIFQIYHFKFMRPENVPEAKIGIINYRFLR